MNTRWIGSGLLGLAGIAVFGCATAYPGAPSAGELVNHLTLPEDSGNQFRGQRADDRPIQLAQAQVTAPQFAAPQYAAPQYSQPAAPVPQRQVVAAPAPTAPAASSGDPLPPPIPLPPTTISAIPSVPGGTGLPIAPPPPPSGMMPASLSSSKAGTIPVYAYVNGRPIFVTEVILSVQMTNPGLLNVRDPEVMKEGISKVLGSMIDMEVAYQEAVHKLEKGNPTALVKLKEYVDEDFQKQTKAMKKAMPPEKFAEIGPLFRRQIERQLIGMEYVRSFVNGKVVISAEHIKDYYDNHPNEFQKISTVKWQHVFIAVNAEHPTPAAALQFADTLLEQVRRGGNFLDLMKHDDGDAKTREGKGFGDHKGEIRPAELEEYLFSKMKVGDVGRLQLPSGTGVHLFRLVDRVDGGLTPFNDTVQTQIRNKMKNQILDREFKRFIRDLRDRAIVEIEKGA
jgi:peptidyl-prolyl cis-trans isomerase SurA